MTFRPREAFVTEEALGTASPSQTPLPSVRVLVLYICIYGEQRSELRRWLVGGRVSATEMGRDP